MNNDLMFFASITIVFTIIFGICYVKLKRYEDEEPRKEKHDWASGYYDAKRYYSNHETENGYPRMSGSQAYFNGWMDYLATRKTIKESSRL